MWTSPVPARRAGLLTLICLVALSTTACTSSDSSSGTSDGAIGSPVTADREPIVTEAPASTSTTAPSATTTAPGPTGVPDPPTAATRLYDAWVAGDRSAAAAIADPQAVEAIFGATPGPYELYRGCDTGEFDTGGCLFRDRSTNNTIQIDVERRDSGWVVSGAFFSPG